MTIVNNRIKLDNREKSVAGHEKKIHVDGEIGKKEDSGKAAGFPNFRGSRKTKIDTVNTSNPTFMFSVVLFLYILKSVL